MIRVRAMAKSSENHPGHNVELLDRLIFVKIEIKGNNIKINSHLCMKDILQRLQQRKKRMCIYTESSVDVK